MRPSVGLVVRSISRILPVAVLGLGLPLDAFAATFAGVSVPPPPAPQSVSDTFFGTRVDDPYRFLEQVADPGVKAWMRGQADATSAILAKIPGRDALLARIREIDDGAGGSVNSVRRSASGRLFFQRREPGDNQFKLVWRDGPDGKDTIVVDPEAMAKATGRPHAIMDFAPSRDGKRLAYSIQVGGGEIGTLHVVDVETGRPAIEPIDRIRYANVAWLDDGSAFFYSRLPEGFEQRPRARQFDDRQRRYRALDAAGTDRLVFSPSRDAGLALPTYASGHIAPIPGTTQALLYVRLGVERNVLVYVGDLEAATRGDAKWRPIVRADDQVSDLAIAGGFVYVRSAAGAPRFKLLRTPLAAPDLSTAEVVLPAGDNVIVDIGGARDALYVARREGAVVTLWRVPHTPAITPQRVALPVEGTVSIGSTDPRDDGALVSLGGWANAAKPFVVTASPVGVQPLKLASSGKYDAPADIEAREVLVTSHDGVKVPVSVLAKKGTRLDGRNPTLIYGYGAYGTTEDPFFNTRFYAWIERGGVIAIAHVRGGGEYGDAWHEAGKKVTKPNTWKDTIATAEWLIANGYTTRDRLGVYGGSAGGILVGRAITERPELFAAAIPAVGTLDMIRAETSANGPANIPEFGTVAKPDEFAALLAMSSYHHVKDGTRYPGVLLVHGVNDIRVDVWQSLKFGARLRAAAATATPSVNGTPNAPATERPVLLRLEYESGHGQGSTRQQLQERAADMWSFFLWQFGVPAFQPPR